MHALRKRQAAAWQYGGCIMGEVHLIKTQIRRLHRMNAAALSSGPNFRHFLRQSKMSCSVDGATGRALKRSGARIAACDEVGFRPHCRIPVRSRLAEVLERMNHPAVPGVWAKSNEGERS